MSSIEANISIDVPDGVDPEQFIASLRQLISSINQKETIVNVIETDNPLSTNVIGPK